MSNKYLIAGCMRSGSSALTGLLQLMGLSLHKDLLKPNNLSPGGCKESKRATRLNEAILASSGMRWNSMLPMPEDWVDHEDYGLWVQAASELIEEADVIKEPRMGRVLPVWIEACRLGGHEPIVLIPNRGVLKVVHSLTRFSPPFSPNSALALWGSHHSDLLKNLHCSSAGYAVHHISYDTMMKDWTYVARKLGMNLSFSNRQRCAIARYLTRSDPSTFRLPTRVFDSSLLDAARLMNSVIKREAWDMAGVGHDSWIDALKVAQVLGWSPLWSASRAVPIENDPEEEEEQRWSASQQDVGKTMETLMEHLSSMTPF